MNDVIYKQVVDQLALWSYLGEKIATNGTRLIGHIPHVGTEAYLHSIYCGLQDSQIKEIESLIQRNIPTDYKVFLKLGNGISLFQKLSLDGLRFNYARDADSSRQPFHMQDVNTWERPKGANPLAVFVGGYSYDASKLYMLPDSPRIYHCPRRDGLTVLNAWPNLGKLLSTEIDRLAKCFDKQGKLIHTNKPTAPLAGTYRA